MEAKDFAMFVRTTQLQKTHDRSKLKLFLAFHDSLLTTILDERARNALSGCSEQSMRLAIRRALTETGSKLLMGRAPPTAMEQLLQGALGEEV